jgi:hypothetical protein
MLACDFAAQERIHTLVMPICPSGGWKPDDRDARYLRHGRRIEEHGSRRPDPVRQLAEERQIILAAEKHDWLIGILRRHAQSAASKPKGAMGMGPGLVATLTPAPVASAEPGIRESHGTRPQDGQ